MNYSKNDIELKLREYRSLMRMKQQFEFELALPADADDGATMELRKELMTLLTPVVVELRRMETYIELLDAGDSAVLKALYINGMTYKEAAAMLGHDEKTINKRKNKGLSELAVMYSRLPKNHTQVSRETPVDIP